MIGQKSVAVDALESALENGFNRHELVWTDPDLDPPGGRDGFSQLIDGLGDCVGAENRTCQKVRSIGQLRGASFARTVA